MKLTVLLATCDRYDTLLPLCLMSIYNQSHPPDRVVLVDDSINKKFYEYTILKNILILFKEKGIEFSYFYGKNKGMVPALQIGLDNISDGWVFKTDDDNILSYNTLELFVNNIGTNIGAMGGVIIDKGFMSYKKNNPNNISKEKDGYYNRIENIYSELNIQMVIDQSDDIKKVEHIYSNYFFNRELVDDYPIELTPSGQREDTIFTYNIFRKGYDLIIIPQIRIQHLNYDNGGNNKWGSIHSDKNEMFFIEKLKYWGIIPNKLQMYTDSNMLYMIKDGVKYKSVNLLN